MPHHLVNTAEGKRTGAASLARSQCLSKDYLRYFIITPVSHIPVGVDVNRAMRFEEFEHDGIGDGDTCICLKAFNDTHKCAVFIFRDARSVGRYDSWGSKFFIENRPEFKVVFNQ